MKKVIALAASTLLACGAPEPPGNTGGTGIPAGPCGRGLVVIESDYHSTNVSLIALDGGVLSPSFVSSASPSTASLSAPLSGDVVTPSALQEGDEVVLIDRYPAGVLTWMSVSGGEPLRQLDVKTGFASNPQDYVRVSANKAYVSRLEENRDPERAPFDRGSDVLVVDPAGPAVVGRIDLRPALAGEDPRFLPRANKLVLERDRLHVLLSPHDASFQDSAASRVVTIDTASDAIEATTVLDGLHGCTGMTLSSRGDALAVVCSGTFEGSSATLAESGVALLQTRPVPKETHRFRASRLVGRPLGFSVAFISERRLLFTTFGELTGTRQVGDDLVSLDVQTGDHEVLRRTPDPFTLGEVRCASACGACFVSDASGEGALLRYAVEGGRLTTFTDIHPAPEIGLPPRYIGGF
jgi:hypothetical protein